MTIVGIDLTFTGGLGLCALPADWAGDFSRVEALSRPTCGGSGSGLARVAAEAVEFCARHGARSVWVEQPIAGGRAFNAVKLAALGGAIASALWTRLGLEVSYVPIPTARKLCFGQVPRFPKGHPLHGKTKQVLHEQLRAMGAPATWDGDACDAFVVSNWGSSRGGGNFVSAPVPVRKRSGKALCAAPSPAR